MLLLKSFASERSVDSASRPRARFLPQLASQPLLSLRIRVCHPNTRIYVRLLGPCFKTGGRKPFRQHLEPRSWLPISSTHPSNRQNFVLSRSEAGRPTGPRGGLHFFSSVRPNVGRAVKRPRREAPTTRFLRGA